LGLSIQYPNCKYINVLSFIKFLVIYKVEFVQFPMATAPLCVENYKQLEEPVIAAHLLWGEGGPKAMAMYWLLQQYGATN